MADTSLVFNIIARDSGVGRALSAVQRAFRGAGQSAEESMSQAGSSTQNLDRMLDEARGRVRGLSEEFERTGDKKLFGQISRDRSLITTLERIRSGLRDTKDDGDSLGSGASALGGVFSRLAGVFSSTGGSVGGMGGQLAGMLPPMGQAVAMALALSAAMFAAVPAIYAVGGAAAALPGLLSGGIAALFTLKLGLSGLAANWKAMNAPAKAGGGGGGGGGAKDDPTPRIRAVEAAQRQVTRSTRDIADAQEDLKDATVALNKAREDEKERIEDVRRSLASAKADEEDSVQSLAEARMALATAEAHGNPDEIRRAQIAVDKQAASLAEAKDKTQDLQKESDEAAKKGVEGSDAVVAAKKRERDAQRAVQDAIEQHKLALQSLADAQKNLNQKIAGAGAAAGGGLGVVLPKIAKSAQEFLNELKRLKPAFDDLRLDIQQRLFEGLAGKLRIMAERWLPALHTHLGAMADMMNGVVKTAFDSISQPAFIKNTMVGVDAVRDALGRIGNAIAGPLVDAWGRLSAASGPFIRMLGDKLAGIVEQFSEWIKKADESGKLQSFMEKATTIVGSLFDIFTNLARIAGSVISILFGTNAGSTDAWENLALASKKVADWLADPGVQARISRYLNMFGGAIFMIGNVASRLDDIWHAGQRMVTWVTNAYNTVKNFFTNLPGTIQSFFTQVGAWFQALPGQIGGWLSSLPGTVGSAMSQAAYQLGYWVGWGIGWLIKQLIALPGRMWNVLKQLPGLARSAVINFVNVLRQLPSLAGNAVRNVGAMVWSAVSSLPGRMYSIGYNIVVGIWNGIQSMAGWLYNAAANFASGIWNGIKNSLGIGSPSKVLAAEVGRWIPAGIAMGMDANAGTVMASAQRLSNALANTRMQIPGVDSGMLDGQLSAATDRVVTVAAGRKQEVTVKFDVTGADGEMKKLIQKLGRTSNLYQNA